MNNLELYEIYKLQSHNSELNCYSDYNDHDDCETDYDEDGNYIDYHQVP